MLCLRRFNLLKIRKALNYEHINSLYSAASLGIDRYVDTREKVLGRFSMNVDKYCSKMKTLVEEGDANNLIFSEDLKNMIHLAKNEHLELICQMIEKFNNQNKDLRFATFVFGPVVMRMLHYLNVPDEAVKLFRDLEETDFFRQNVSNQILLDLLYEHKKYNLVVEISDSLRQKQVNMMRFPTNVMILTMASLYKMNTKESFEQAVNIWSEMIKVGHVPVKRTTSFFAALAINQNAPHTAVEALGNVREQKYVTIRNLKLLALVNMNKIDNIIPILRTPLEVDAPGTTTGIFLEEIMNKVEEVMKQADKIVQNDFSHILNALREQKMISTTTMDELLCHEINYTPMTNQNKMQLSSSFRRDNTRPQRFQREGLSQMY